LSDAAIWSILIRSVEVATFGEIEWTRHVGDCADYARWIAGHDMLGRNISRDHAARLDERTLTDRHERENGRVHPDLSAALDGRSAHTQVCPASGMRIVREAHAGCDTHIVRDRRELGDVAIAADADAVPDGASRIDKSVVPDLAIVADGCTLADDNVPTHLEAVSD